MPVPNPFDVKPPTRGWLHRVRHLFQTFAIGLMLAAPFADLLRFDIAGGQLVLLRTRFALGELGAVYFLALIIMLTFVALAVLYGRVWCGWACPQNTLSELATAIERRVMGKKTGGTGRRLVAGTLTTLAAAVIAASMVSYFIAPQDYTSPPLPALVAFGLLTVLMAADMLVVRQRFCRGICPYGILQSLLQDEYTLGVTLVEDAPARCVRCGCCFKACPIGIDIRESPFDMHCLACGDCVDAGNHANVHKGMPKMVKFQFGTATSSWPRFLARVGILDAKRFVAVVVLIAAGTVYSCSRITADALTMSVTPDFTTAALLDDGHMSNEYSLSFANRGDRPVNLHLAATGIEGLHFDASQSNMSLEPGQRLRISLELRAPTEGLTPGAHDITFTMTPSTQAHPTVVGDTKFFVKDSGR